MKALHGVAFWLVIVGGINWGLLGLSSFFGQTWDLVYMLIGSWSMIVAELVYLLVGISAVYLVVTHKRDWKCCDSSMTEGQPKM